MGLPNKTLPIDNLIRDLEKVFRDLYGTSPRLFQAPGRVNLIGEHTDYNDGFVMPAAIGFQTYVAAAPRQDRRIAVRSLNYGESREFEIGEPSQIGTHHWSNYIGGVAALLDDNTGALQGANLAVSGNVPIGAGLSSSAALEVAVAFALLGISRLNLDRWTIAKCCQKAEHRFAGTQCGIMDQFIACFAVEDSALLLDCRNLFHDPERLPADTRLVVCNTKVKHSLADSEYNRRRAECEEGVRLLQKKFLAIRALRDVMLFDLEDSQNEMPEVIYRRCRHVITENRRVLEAGDALRKADLPRFGELMLASHRSLRDDYEVSCRELDLMVEIAMRCPGVYGSRMTGGGFGGCTVNLVRSESAADFMSIVSKDYAAATGIKPEIYDCQPAAGASEVSFPF